MGRFLGGWWFVNGGHLVDQHLLAVVRDEAIEHFGIGNRLSVSANRHGRFHAVSGVDVDTVVAELDLIALGFDPLSLPKQHVIAVVRMGLGGIRSGNVGGDISGRWIGRTVVAPSRQRDGHETRAVRSKYCSHWTSPRFFSSHIFVAK